MNECKPLPAALLRLPVHHHRRRCKHLVGAFWLVGYVLFAPARWLGRLGCVESPSMAPLPSPPLAGVVARLEHGCVGAPALDAARGEDGASCDVAVK